MIGESRRGRGLTLIELIVALTVTAIVASFSITLIAAPPSALEASNRRASLRENATQAMAVVERSWRDALPNSLRFRSAAGVLAIEYLNVLDSAVLFRDDPAVPAAERLTIGVADNRFETLGDFPRLTKPLDSTALYIALHHSGAAGANAWAMTDVISAPGSRVRIAVGSAPGQAQVQLTPAALFTAIGPSRRVYLLSGPVSYLCNRATGTLTRYSGYAIASSQAQRDSDAELMAAGAVRAVVASGVSNCRLAATNSAAAGQRLHYLTVTFRDGTDQVVANISQVANNAG
jgi:MSHA biogenesis protein MshO